VCLCSKKKKGQSKVGRREVRSEASWMHSITGLERIKNRAQSLCKSDCSEGCRREKKRQKHYKRQTD
jgi:hypothetical protein